ncbi:hypothetical protein TELCIR_18518, partial [Teladorsagia circumcincta]
HNFHPGEKDKYLDVFGKYKNEVNAKITQRNLNSLKSVFGGFFKNKFSRKPQEGPIEIAEFITSLFTKFLKACKRLGQDLGKEVDEQNQLLDRIQVKADRNDTIVRVQDKQMQKILGSETKNEESSSMTP